MTLLTEQEIRKMIIEIFPYASITESLNQLYVSLETHKVSSTELNKIKGKYEVSINYGNEITLIFKIN